jgi:hypothetical protein
MTNQVDTEGIRIQEAVLKALKNMGHDTTCGTCMAQAFTGAAQGKHTCIKGKNLTSPASGVLTIEEVTQALEQHRDEFEGAADHLFFLQAVIATNLKNTGMPKDIYLDGCGKAWDIDDEPQETIPRNTH